MSIWALQFHPTPPHPDLSRIFVALVSIISGSANRQSENYISCKPILTDYNSRSPEIKNGFFPPHLAMTLTDTHCFLVYKEASQGEAAVKILKRTSLKAPSSLKEKQRPLLLLYIK